MAAAQSAQLVMRTARQYLRGAGQLSRNAVRAAAIRRKRAPTFSEDFFAAQTSQDLRGLLPFLGLLLVMPEAIPVLAVSNPNLLPSTFSTAEEKEERLALLGQQQAGSTLEALLALGQTQEGAEGHPGVVAVLAAARAPLGLARLPDASCDVPPEAVQWARESPLLELPPPLMRNVARRLGVAPGQIVLLLKRRLRKRLELIDAHDDLLRSHGLEAPSTEELRFECRLRGLRAVDEPAPAMRNALARWLALEPADVEPALVLNSLHFGSTQADGEGLGEVLGL